MKNPCYDCDFLGEDKNEPRCVDCRKRQMYVAYIADPDKSLNVIGRKEPEFEEEVPVKEVISTCSNKVDTSQRKYRPWTDEDKAFLEKNYWRYDTPTIAEIMGRTANTVGAKLSGMGINRNIALLRKIMELEERIEQLEKGEAA